MNFLCDFSRRFGLWVYPRVKVATLDVDDVDLVLARGIVQGAMAGRIGILRSALFQAKLEKKFEPLTLVFLVWRCRILSIVSESRRPFLSRSPHSTEFDDMVLFRVLNRKVVFYLGVKQINPSKEINPEVKHAPNWAQA